MKLIEQSSTLQRPRAVQNNLSEGKSDAENLIRGLTGNNLAKDLIILSKILKRNNYMLFIFGLNRWYLTKIFYKDLSFTHFWCWEFKS